MLKLKSSGLVIRFAPDFDKGRAKREKLILLSRVRS